VNYEPPVPEAWDQPEAPKAGRSRPSFSVNRLWEWLIGFLRRSPAGDVEMPEVPPLEMPDLLDVHEPSDTFTIESPAKGDAFNFLIRVRCSWCVQGTATAKEKERRTAQIRDFIETSRTITRERIEERIRPIARRFPPYRAAEAEEVLNKEISDCLRGGDVRVTVRAWVDVCDPVREDLQKVWQQRLMVDAEGDLKEVYVNLLTSLQAAWQRLLVTGMEGIGTVPEAAAGWLAPYALALAEDPKNPAQYLRSALDHRVSHAEKLLTDLGGLVMDDQIEAIEFAFQSDSALRAVLTYLGVPVPSRNGANDGPGGADHA
jgi:hypothetical protein